MYGGIRGLVVSQRDGNWKGGEEMQQGRVRAGALVTYTRLVVIAANYIGAELGASSREAGSATLGHLARACVALRVLPCE